MLTKRATDFLSTLERREHLPTESVSELIVRAGFEPLGHWLAFHERYAGYVDDLGNDDAILGLAHRSPQWLEAEEIEIEEENDGVTRYITCADVHPSYTYQLDHRGEFLGGPARSFDVHFERKAMGWEFGRDRKVRFLSAADFRGVRGLEPDEGHVVQEASDEFSRYVLVENYLVVTSGDGATVRKAWQREP